ncbi:hypothetical protein [Actinoplanes derwentensis]|nr:hypothetical protein [Actinoplanes derwentensis]
MIPAWRARAGEELAGYEPVALARLEPTLVDDDRRPDVGTLSAGQP